MRVARDACNVVRRLTISFSLSGVSGAYRYVSSRRSFRMMSYHRPRGVFHLALDLRHSSEYLSM